MATQAPRLSTNTATKLDKRQLTVYGILVIWSFRHRGLKLLFERDDHRFIRTDLVDRVEVMLAQLDVAATVEAMRIPNYRLHALKGDLKGYWSVTVRGNWRIIFRFEDGNAHNVELIDYH